MHKSRFSGQFYPSSKAEIEEELKKYVDKKANKLGVKGAIVPHAGWIYSGKCAGKVYSVLEEFDSVLILGTNHNSYLNSLSLEDFQTPLGIIKNDVELGEKILENTEIENNERVFEFEHSIEVQLPFLQKIGKIIPLLVSNHKGLAEGIVRAIKESRKRVLILASSDFTHSGPSYDFIGDNEKLDREAINKILKLDTKEFLEVNTTICGKEPIALCLEICKLLGAKKGKLLDYYDSSKIQISSNKVGYAGIIIS